MRTGRYKKKLVSAEILKSEGPLLAPLIEGIVKDWRQKAISDVEFVARYIVFYLKHRRGKLWKGARFKIPLTEHPLPPTLEIFSRFSLRGVPLEVNRALVYWAQNQYPLRLFFRVPDPIEVLTMQCENFRCVTVVIAPDKLTEFVEGERDPLGFVLHDLIHADKFYRDEFLRQGQLEFYRLMKRRIDAGIYQELLSDSQFQKDLHYIVSDMNSHPAHLEQTLAAVIQLAQSRKLRPSTPRPAQELDVKLLL